MWAIAGLITCGVALRGQQPVPAFEVASVKVNRSGAVLSSMAFQPGGFSATNVTVHQLILMAYGLQSTQLAGGPAWIGSPGGAAGRGGGPGDVLRFDVIARAPAKVRPSPLMLRTLLAERFRLKAHTEPRDLPLYELVIARGDRRLGPQLRPSTIDCDAFVAGSPTPGPVAEEREECDEFTGAPPRMMAGGVSMEQLADGLARNIRDTVVDRTGLTGLYDFELQWTPDFLPPQRDASEPLRLNGFVVDRNGPTIFTAVREQLGLELRRGTGPVDVLIVDSVSPPDPD